MEGKTLEEIAEKLLSFEGKVKGEAFRTHKQYIEKKEGEEGVKKVEEKMAQLGAPIEFEKIKPLRWYDEGRSSLVIVVAKDIFNWSKDDVYEMGRFSAKSSFIVKVLMRYFVSLDKVLKETPNYWRKYCDFGEVEVVELNKKRKYIILHIREADLHPLVYLFYAGYFHGFAEMNIKSEEIKVEEIKCRSKGAFYHEYLITWK